MSELHVFELGGHETVIAHDVADAWAIMKEFGDAGPEDYEGEEFVQVPDETHLWVGCEDEPAANGWPNNDGWTQKKPGGFWSSKRTCAEWCALSGRGHLGSDEW